MPSRLHARTSSRPAARQPATRVGRRRESGTARLRRMRSGATRTSPIERSPRSYQSSRFERSGAIGSAPSMCTIAVTRPPGSRRPRSHASTGSSQSAAKSSSAIRAASSCGIGSGKRHRVRDLGRIGELRRRHVEREEAAGEPGRQRRRRDRGAAVGSPRQRRRTRSLCPSMITAAS